MKRGEPPSSTAGAPTPCHRLIRPSCSTSVSVSPDEGLARRQAPVVEPRARARDAPPLTPSDPTDPTSAEDARGGSSMATPPPTSKRTAKPGTRLLPGRARDPDARRTSAGAAPAASWRPRASSTPSCRWPACSGGPSATRRARRSAGSTTSWRAGPTGRSTRRSAGSSSGSAAASPSSPPSAIDRIGHAEVLLRSSRLDLRDVVRRPGRGAAGQGRARPPAGRRRGRPGHPRRRPLPGRGPRPHPPGRRRRLDRHPAAPARPAPLAPASHARPGHRLGRHPALQRADRRGRTADGDARSAPARRPTRACTGCAPASWPTCSRTCAATSAASCSPRSAPTRRPTPSRRCSPRTSSSCCASRTRWRRRACWPPWSPTRRSTRCATCPLAVRGEVLRHIPAKTALALRELLGYAGERGRRHHDHRAGHGQVGGQGEEGRRPAVRGARPRRRPRCGGGRRQRRPPASAT